LSDRDDEIRAEVRELMERLSVLMDRARPIVEKLTSPAGQVAPADGQDDATKGEVPDD
jgi:hypothetical protein